MILESNCKSKMMMMRDLKKTKVCLALVLMIMMALSVCCQPNIRTMTEGNCSLPVAGDDLGGIAPTSDMNVPRSGHTATLLLNGQVLISGGMERNGVYFKSAELYDPSTGKFTSTNRDMTTERVGHTATLLPNGRVLLIGGWDRKGVQTSAEIYDSTAERLTLTGKMSIGRGDFTATLLQNGKVLIAGGENDRTLADGGVLVVGGYDIRSQASVKAWVYKR